MDGLRDSNNYSIPIYFKDQANDLKNIEAEAKRALQNINSLYEEIMHTDSPDNFEFENNVDSNITPSTSTSTTDKKQYTAKIKRFTESSRKFYFRSQLPLTHCLGCHDHYYDTNITSRSLSTEEKFNCDSEIHLSKESNAQSSKDSGSPLKITKPQPFKLSGFDEQRLEAKERRLAKLREEKEQQMQKELNVKVVSKPVPKHTHLPLYNKMVEKNEKRRNERKEESLRVIGRGNKSLPQGDVFQTNVTLKSLPSESKSCFKATPVPKHILSNKVSEKLKNKEEIRKMLSAHRAEEMLKQSSSPLSKKTIPRSFSMLNLNDYKKNDERDKRSKPNITAITNRLYTKKCKETMNNWNDKVMRYCYKENEIKSNVTILNKFKPQPEQSLPFLYYPVRMSTAASLRNKQIRSEIIAREKKEEYQNNEISEAQQEMHEEISKKLQKLLPDIDPDREIEERVKNFRESQLNREEEYEHELEEIMKRVSQQYLLIERQSKKGIKKANSLKDITYEEENTSVLNSDTDTKSDHLEEKESVSESEESEDSG
ncbi:protein FAM161A [Parasteatoda tepidariorum]|uniref:protein FAM161A n=1 Tax=Parasteatoda tepidariorum TaxID=114398 RepID=UPI001C71DF62|nr:protein FAM161A isoform X1 [Parasteatoda tepidariorum]